jgi:hypothetical protein
MDLKSSDKVVLRTMSSALIICLPDSELRSGLINYPLDSELLGLINCPLDSELIGLINCPLESELIGLINC